MNKLSKYIEQIKTSPQKCEFKEVIEVIESYYDYTPAQFSNGIEPDQMLNKAGENEGSCKIFSFALLHGLNKQQTLLCFGKFYREDVLNDPKGTCHKNIRCFIKHGWGNIHFEGKALKPKSEL